MKKVFLAGVCLLALAGCGTDVTTSVDVRSATESNIVASVTLSGEAADLVRTDKTQAEALEKVFEERTSKDVDVDDTDGKITYSSELTYQELVDSSDLLGVSALSVDGSEHEVHLRAELVEPGRLKEAITAAVAGQDDGVATAAAILGTTNVSLSVHYPGEIAKATASEGLEAKRSGDTVTVAQTLAEYRTGSLDVTGDPSVPFLERYRYPLLGVAALVVLAAVGNAVRNRRRPRR